MNGGREKSLKEQTENFRNHVHAWTAKTDSFIYCPIVQLVGHKKFMGLTVNDVSTK